MDDGFWNEWHWRKKQEKAGFVNKIEQKQNSLKKVSVVSGTTIVGATRCDAKIKWEDRIIYVKYECASEFIFDRNFIILMGVALKI